MASGVYNTVKARLMRKDIDLGTGGDSLYVSLHTASYVPDPDHATSAQLTNEVVGDGYVAGGKELTGQTVTQDNAGDVAVFDADNVVWPSSTITARYAVVRDVTVSNALVCWVDFGEDKAGSGETFRIKWAASGICRIS